MWPPLPIRSTMAQCPWRIWMSSNSKPTSSDLRKPQPNNMANIAKSRLARIVSPWACLSTSELCSALNQVELFVSAQFLDGMIDMFPSLPCRILSIVPRNCPTSLFDGPASREFV
jgi:hypothetical protein